MPDANSLTVESNLAVPMRDGVTLYADVYRPEGPGPFPVLLQRTPYDKTTPGSMLGLDPLKAAKHGSAVVIQDTRGRYASEGEFLYNPANPVPTVGGALCCNPYFAASGAFEQQEIEAREDVLVYTTPPLERDVEVTGPVTVNIVGGDLGN